MIWSKSDCPQFSFRACLVLPLVIWLSGHGVAVCALESDKGKPAVIDADEVEFDFRNGTRTYIGNVIVIQGTLRITGDKMIVKYKEEEQLESATAWGNPATFKQRPDGKQADVEGKGRTITLDDASNTLTLIKKASLKQGPDIARGNTIVYNMSTDKMIVKGSATSTSKPSKQADQKAGEPEKPTRSRVIITPQRKPAP